MLRELGNRYVHLKIDVGATWYLEWMQAACRCDLTPPVELELNLGEAGAVVFSDTAPPAAWTTAPSPVGGPSATSPPCPPPQPTLSQLALPATAPESLEMDLVQGLPVIRSRISSSCFTLRILPCGIALAWPRWSAFSECFQITPNRLNLFESATTTLTGSALRPPASPALGLY